MRPVCCKASLQSLGFYDTLIIFVHNNSNIKNVEANLQKSDYKEMYRNRFWSYEPSSAWQYGSQLKYSTVRKATTAHLSTWHFDMQRHRKTLTYLMKACHLLL